MGDAGQQRRICGAGTWRCVTGSQHHATAGQLDDVCVICIEKAISFINHISCLFRLNKNNVRSSLIIGKWTLQGKCGFVCTCLKGAWTAGARFHYSEGSLTSESCFLPGRTTSPQSKQSSERGSPVAGTALGPTHNVASSYGCVLLSMPRLLAPAELLEGSWLAPLVPARQQQQQLPVPPSFARANVGEHKPHISALNGIDFIIF